MSKNDFEKISQEILKKKSPNNDSNKLQDKI